eukprot:Stramenopile-MAST_4_protein_2472
MQTFDFGNFMNQADAGNEADPFNLAPPVPTLHERVPSGLPPQNQIEGAVSQHRIPLSMHENAFAAPRPPGNGPLAQAPPPSRRDPFGHAPAQRRDPFAHHYGPNGANYPSLSTGLPPSSLQQASGFINREVRVEQSRHNVEGQPQQQQVQSGRNDPFAASSCMYGNVAFGSSDAAVTGTVVAGQSPPVPSTGQPFRDPFAVASGVYGDNVTADTIGVEARPHVEDVPRPISTGQRAQLGTTDHTNAHPKTPLQEQYLGAADTGASRDDAALPARPGRARHNEISANSPHQPQEDMRAPPKAEEQRQSSSSYPIRRAWNGGQEKHEVDANESLADEKSEDAVNFIAAGKPLQEEAGLNVPTEIPVQPSSVAGERMELAQEREKLEAEKREVAKMRAQLKLLLSPALQLEVSPEYGAAELASALNCSSPSRKRAKAPSIDTIFEAIRMRSPERKIPAQGNHGLELAKEHLKLTLLYREAHNMGSSMARDERNNKISSVTQLYAKRLARMSSENTKLASKCARLENALCSLWQMYTATKSSVLPGKSDLRSELDSPQGRVIPTTATSVSKEDDSEDWERIQHLLKSLEKPPKAELESTEKATSPIPVEVDSLGTTERTAFEEELAAMKARLKEYELTVAHAKRIHTSYRAGHIVERGPLKEKILELLVGKPVETSISNSWASMSALLGSLGATRREQGLIREFLMLGEDDLADDGWGTWLFGGGETAEEKKEQYRLAVLEKLKREQATNAAEASNLSQMMEEFHGSHREHEEKTSGGGAQDI